MTRGNNQLSQIAPTIALQEHHDERWKDQYLQIADTLGRTDQAKQQLAAYNQCLAEFRSAMGDRLSTTEVSVLTFGADNTPFLYVKSSFIGSVLQDVGLSRPRSQNVFLANGTGFFISLERLSEADGDVILLLTSVDNRNFDAVKNLRSHPLWSQLNAARQSRVYEMDESFGFCSGILTANAILDNLFKCLVNTS